MPPTEAQFSELISLNLDFFENSQIGVCGEGNNKSLRRETLEGWRIYLILLGADHPIASAESAVLFACEPRLRLREVPALRVVRGLVLDFLRGRIRLLHEELVAAVDVPHRASDLLSNEHRLPLLLPGARRRSARFRDQVLAEGALRVVRHVLEIRVRERPLVARPAVLSAAHRSCSVPPSFEALAIVRSFTSVSLTAGSVRWGSG